jgi:flavodoxin
MKKAFIYYSLTGNVKSLARLFSIKGYDIYEIVPCKSMPKSMAIMMMKYGFLALIHRKTPINKINIILDNYDEIVIGTPIWNARCSTPINTFLLQNDLSKKKLTFVASSGGGSAHSFDKFVKKHYEKSSIIHIKMAKNNKDFDALLATL